MIRKDPEVKVFFQYACLHEEKLTTITYQKPKTVDSVIKCLVEEVSESLDKLRIEKNISCTSKICYLKFQTVDDVPLTKTLQVDINDAVKLKKTVETILGTFTAADQEIYISIKDSPSSCDQEEVFVFSTDNSRKKSTVLGDDALDLKNLRTNLKILNNDEDRKNVGANAKNVCIDEDTKGQIAVDNELDREISKYLCKNKVDLSPILRYGRFR